MNGRNPAGVNIVPQPLLATPSLVPPIPMNPQLLPATQVYVGQVATILLEFNALPSPPMPSLVFTRPDGTTYPVAGSPYLYSNTILGRPYVVYTFAAGELSLGGWWRVKVLGPTDSIGTNNYQFYIYGNPSFFQPIVGPPTPPIPPVTPTNGYVLEDDVTYYVAEDGVTYYVQES